jgi:DNA-binding NarL/FixJ family response regulator
MPLKIYISCCSHLFEEGIKRLIKEDGPEMDSVDIYCGDHNRVIDINPDLLIVDFNTLSAMSLDTLVKPRVGILLLGTTGLPLITNDRLSKLVSKGLIGILPPMTIASEFNKAIRSIISGELWFERKRLKDIITNINSVKEETEPCMTKKEKEIVMLICRGYRNKEIMQRLNVSEQAVKSHLKRINRKFGVSDRLQLALHAIKRWPDYLNDT